MSWVTNSLREIIIKTQVYVGTDNVIFYQEFLIATLEILSDIMTTLEHQVLITKQKLHEATIYLPKLKDFIDSILLLVEIVNSCGTGNEMLFFRKFSAFTKLLNQSIISIKEWLGEEDSQISDFSTIKEDLKLIWVDNVINHISQHDYGCIVLWISDKIVDQALTESEGDQAVIIGITPSEFEYVISLLQICSSQKFKGRCRIAIDSTETKLIVNTFKTGPLGNVGIPILVNKEQVDENDVFALVLRKGLILSSGLIGFNNFVKMANLLWIGSVDPLMQSFSKNGIVVSHVTSFSAAISFIEENSYVCYSKTFRIIIDEFDNRGNVAKLIGYIRLHPSYPCIAPIFFRINDYPDYEFIEDGVFKYPYIKEFIKTSPNYENDFASFGYMTPLNWWKYNVVNIENDMKSKTVFQIDNSCSTSKSEEQRSPREMKEKISFNSLPYLKPAVVNGILTINTLRCYNLYPMDSNGKSDPYCVIYINNEEKKKTSIVKKSLFPDWGALVDWKFEVNSNDVIKFEVLDWDRVGTPDFEGQTELYVYNLVNIIGEREEKVIYLKSGIKERKKGTNTKIRGTIHIDFTFTKNTNTSSNTSSNTGPSIPQHVTSNIHANTHTHVNTLAKHFGRPLVNSLLQAEEDGVLHPFCQCIASLYNLVHTEGLFRLPGNKTIINEIRDKIDSGIRVSLIDVDAHDLASLLKAYFAHLPHPLLPLEGNSISSEFKRTHNIEEVEEKIEAMIMIDLLSFLHRVSLQSEINKMIPQNLSVCWTPTILLPKEESQLQASLQDTPLALHHLAWMIEHADLIFPPFPRVSKVALDSNHFRFKYTPYKLMRVPPSEIIKRYENSLIDIEYDSKLEQEEEPFELPHQSQIHSQPQQPIATARSEREMRRDSSKKKSMQVRRRDKLDKGDGEKGNSDQNHEKDKVVYHSMSDKEDLESATPIKLEKNENKVESRKSTVAKGFGGMLAKGRVKGIMGNDDDKEKKDPPKTSRSLVQSHNTVPTHSVTSPRVDIVTTPMTSISQVHSTKLQIQELLIKLSPEDLAQVKLWLKNEVCAVPQDDFAKYS